MSRYFYIPLFSVMCFFAQARCAEIPDAPQQETVTEDVQQETEKDDVDELLEMAGDTEIEMPDIQPPSAIMVMIRRMGISLLYKYAAVKQWLLKKWHRNA